MAPFLGREYNNVKQLIDALVDHFRAENYFKITPNRQLIQAAALR